jgi:hypothetical protein
MGSPMPRAAVLWNRLDQAGHDSARLSESAAGAIIEGTAVFEEAGRPCRLDYRVVCDAAWLTVSARVTGWLDAATVDLTIDVDATRTWTIAGERRPDLRDCVDIDLSFTPATNLLPIRRCSPAVGERVPVRAAWLGFPEMSVEPLDQVYERLSESRYRYESGQGSFVLETNAVGFVTRYPGLWEITR